MEKAFMNELISLRHELHQHPEISCHEFETQRRIRAFLEKLGCKDVSLVARTGLLCHFDSGQEGPKILIRGDMDALPIEEINEFEYRSQNKGVGHQCGHDGHSTILCGLAKKLIDEPITKGQVLLVFQPAEENGEGAKGVLADHHYDFDADFAFALHNLPGYPLHQLVYRSGSFTAAAKSIIIKLEGRTSHAAEPELGNNPATAIAEIIRMFERVSVPDLEADDFALATPIHIHMGELAYGTSAGSGEVHYTLRSWDNRVMNAFVQKIETAIEKIAQEQHLKFKIDWTEEFSANQTSEEAVSIIRAAAANVGLDICERKVPFKWGEDFGLFTERYSGAMFGLGSGEDHPALHNPDYDFPDALIETGIQMFYAIIRQILK